MMPKIFKSNGDQDFSDVYYVAPSPLPSVIPSQTSAPMVLPIVVNVKTSFNTSYPSFTISAASLSSALSSPPTSGMHPILVGYFERKEDWWDSALVVS